MLPRPRKHLGQHFLTDRHYIARIVAAINPQREDRMVEIGPGPGAMTEPLVLNLNHVHVVEVDPELAAALRGRLGPERLSVHEADVLEFNFTVLPAPLRIVGNLPYNISTPILFHIAQFADRVYDCTFMLQKEVVDRMVAAPSTPAYGRLSVMLQYRFAMEKLFNVPPGAFYPPPKVDSAIVRMVPFGADRVRARNETLFAKIVMAGFSQRRKTLRNSLKHYLTGEDWPALGIDGQLRAENLSTADFIAIADRAVIHHAV